MNSLLDVLISMIIGGSVLLAALRTDSSLKTNTMHATYQLSTQENLSTLKEIIEYDFRKIGHSLGNPWGAITLADSSRIIFSYDQDPSSTFDSMRVEYVLSATSTTSNPNDKILTRVFNGQSTSGASLGVTEFKLWYYNRHGTQLPRPVVADSLSKIKTIELELVVQSVESIEGEYAETRFQTLFTPKNLLPN